MIEGALELVFALGGLVLFAIVFGTVLDNHARRLDPASPYYGSQQAR